MLELGARESPPGTACRACARLTKSQYSSRITCMSVMPSRRSSRSPRSTPSTAGQHVLEMAVQHHDACARRRARGRGSRRARRARRCWRRGWWCPETPRRRRSAAATCSRRGWSARRARRSFCATRSATAVGSTTSTDIARCGPCCSVAPSGRITIDAGLRLRRELRPRQLRHEHAFCHSSRSLEHHRAAVRADALPGHEGRARPGQEDRRRGDLLRLARCGRADCRDSFASVSGEVDSGPSIGVSVGPGAIALTRMCGANSRAQERVIETHAALRGAVERAVLAAEIGQLRGDVDDAPGASARPWRGALRGRPGRRRAGSRRSAGRNPPRVVSSSGFSIRMPALLTRMSRPTEFRQRRLEESQRPAPRRRCRPGRAKARRRSPRSTPRPCRSAPVGARSTIATCAPSAANARRDRPADAARGAGDQRPLCRASDPSDHRTSPRSTLTACPVMFFAWSEARKR